MSKILAFNGSARENGYTAKIINQILAGAKECSVNIKQYNLERMDIRFCRGCLYCRKTAVCAIDDDMQDVYEQMENADGIILGIPIYFRQMTGQCKTFIDRLFPLYSSEGPRMGNKKVVLVYTQGYNVAEKYQTYISATTEIFKLMGWEVEEVLVCYGTNSGLADKNIALMEKAYETGVKMARL
jgi:Multimeric flavodoxin WrbA